MPDEVQAEMIGALRGLLARGTTWFLRSRRLFEPTDQQVARFAPMVQSLRAEAAERDASPRAARWVQAGAPKAETWASRSAVASRRHSQA